MHLIKKAVFLGVALILIFSTGCSVGASSQNGGLIISEVVTSNSNSYTDPVFGRPDWVELCNTSTNPINLLDYSIAESNKNRFDFPDVTIAPGEYMILYCCSNIEGASSDNLCTGFKLSKSGTALVLSSPGSVLQKLDIPALETDISYGITKDGTYAYFGIPTPGAANTTESSPDLAGLESDKAVSLKINEVMPKASTNAASGWAEIFNAGDKAVELSDYYITEDLSDPTKARLPEKQLGAGEYAIVRFTGNTAADEVPFKLGSDETTLALSNNFGAVIDNMSWNASILPGMSAGRQGTSAVYFIEPTPGEDNGAQYTEGVTLLEGVSDVRINEILLKNDFSLIDQDGDRFEWAELYNSSPNTVSLLGYALSDREDDPLKWRLPDVELGAGQYLIVFLSGKDRAEGELHANFSLGDGDTKLLLSNINTGTVQTAGLPAEKKDNVSCGLSPDGQWLFYYQPTPGAENSAQGFTEISQVESQTPGLRINEVAAVSKAKSGDPDWVELHNQLSTDINLSGFFLSDNKDDLQKWPLGDLTVKAGGYKAIDGYKNEDGAGEIELSSSGEKIYLSNPQGEVIDQFDTGALRPGLSRGLKSDNTVALFDTPTPNKANSEDALQGYCAAPVFSVSGGYKNSSFELEMSAPAQGGTIHYTLDGSTPTANSAEYTAPVKITKTTAVRAITSASGKLNSDETVATYIFDKPHSLPVVCLSMTQSDLNTVLKSSRDNKRERGGYVEYFEADGTLGVRFPAGFRIAGAGTIDKLHAPQMSINLYLRGGYGRSSVTYPFFGGYDITTFKSLSLRNMGWSQDPTRLKDVFVPMAANGLNVDNMQSKFCVVYINGKYWGLYEFKENQNEEYFASKHNIDPDKVVMIRGNKYNVDIINKTGRFVKDPDILDLYDLAKRNMNDPDIFEEYTSLADSDCFMDYLIAETFFGCYDSYNQKYAHTTDNSMKWRPLMYDFDLCLTGSAVNFETFFRDKVVRGPAAYGGGPRETWMYLYNAFIKNDEWKEKFIERYAEVLNTVFTTDKLLSLYDGMVDSIRSEITLTSKKWGMPKSLNKWETDQKALRKIIAGRRDKAIKQLKSYFNLSDGRMKELFPNG